MVSSAAGTDQRASDWALIARVVAQDETALAALYDRYSGMVCSVLNRILRDTAAAEEILQDIFFQIWKNAGQFDPARGSLPGWLVVAARNRAISRLRRKGLSDSEELVENNIILPFNLETQASQNQLMGRVKGALDGLPKEQREAVERYPDHVGAGPGRGVEHGERHAGLPGHVAVGTHPGQPL